ncbi:MAG: response regulator [Clostridia bacterium]|nr:response regulator [Clostridia bacterium]
MKILIVDDEEHALRSLTDCVTELRPGDDIHPFLRSDEALSFAKTEGLTLDVAFLDINMPVLNGIELAKELKKIHSRLSVIFCTAYTEFVVDAIRLRASGYIHKPYSMRDIEKELNDVLNYPGGEMPKIFARTFGEFEFFYEGVPVSFKREKSKELFAYLIYKNGGSVDRKDLAALFFKGDRGFKAQREVVKIYKDLVKDLQAHDLGKIVQKTLKQYSLDVMQFSCDFYDYVAGKPHAINAFNGEFMTQYGWAELPKN